MWSLLYNCVVQLFKGGKINSSKCPICRYGFNYNDIENIRKSSSEPVVEELNINKWGTKMSNLINYINRVKDKDSENRIIVFSQWDSMLKMVSNVLESFNIKYVFINGTIFSINCKIQKFKTDSSIRVVLMSSDKAASGLNLTEANHIVLLDTVDTEKARSLFIEEQAIGRAVRLGQTKQVKVQRFISTMSKLLYRISSR